MADTPTKEEMAAEIAQARELRQKAIPENFRPKTDLLDNKPENKAGGGGSDNKDENGNEDNFVIEYDQKNFEKPAPAKGKDGKDDEPKLNLKRYSPYVGKEDLTEDDIEETFKSFKSKETEYEAKLKEKDNKLAIVLEGRKQLKDNKDYQYYSSVAKQSPERQVEIAWTAKYMDNGLDEAQATAKAKERVAEELEKNKHYIEDTAGDIRKNAERSAWEIEQSVQKQIEESSKDVVFVKPTKDFEGKVKDAQKSFDNFMGMKLSKDENQKKAILDKSYVDPEEMNKLLKDPATYLEVSYYLKNKDILRTNISNRLNGKAEVINRLAKTPSGGGLNERRLPVSKADNSKKGARPAVDEGVGFLGEKR